MTPTQATEERRSQLIDSVGDAEKASLEAVRRFVDTVDGAFPGGGDDGPRQRIIDSAFKMTEQLVGASNRLAQNVLDLTERELGDADSKPAKRRS